MRQVLWTDLALADRERIVRYIAEDNLAAALNLLDRFDAVGDQLEQFPMSGRQGRVSGTREIVVHENYIVVYTLAMDVVHIVNVLHAAQLWPQNSE